MRRYDTFTYAYTTNERTRTNETHLDLDGIVGLVIARDTTHAAVSQRQHGTRIADVGDVGGRCARVDDQRRRAALDVVLRAHDLLVRRQERCDQRLVNHRLRLFSLVVRE
jgi:hypothetical protein